VASDPYGTDVLLTNDGDLAVTPAGQLALVDGPMNCAQALVMRLRTSPGELPLQPDYGNAIAPRIIGTKTNDPTLVVSKLNIELRAIFTADRRFLRAERITASSDPAYPTRTGVYIELVLAGGDRLTAADVANTPALDAFSATPELAESIDPDELADIAGANPDELEDDIPELAEDLEGFATSFDEGGIAA
jgi:hypothetical protein